VDSRVPKNMVVANPSIVAKNLHAPKGVEWCL
jgi:hypothetical protein